MNRFEVNAWLDGYKQAQKEFSYDDYYYDFVPGDDDLDYYDPNDYPDYDLGVLDREQIGGIKRKYKIAADKDAEKILAKKKRRGSIVGSILGAGIGAGAGYLLDKNNALKNSGIGLLSGAALGGGLGRYLGKKSGIKAGNKIRGDYYKERDSKIDRLLEMTPEDRRELRDMARREHDLREQERLAKAQLAALAGQSLLQTRSNYLLGRQNDFMSGGFTIKPSRAKKK